MNEPDSYALEEALRLKEKHGGEVVVLSMGPERVKPTIKEALAKGADRGIHIVDDNFAQLDPLGSAKALAAAVKKEKVDLVLTDRKSTRLNSSHLVISYAVFCLKKKKRTNPPCIG